MSKNPTTICDILIDRVNKNPKGNAIGSLENKTINFINFKNYKEIIESLSIALVNLGVNPYEKVGILSHTRKEWNFFDLAIMSTGAVTVPVYPTYTAEEAEYILDHCEATVLIVENHEQFEKFIEIQNKLPNIKRIISIENIKSPLREKLHAKTSYSSYDECINLGIQKIQENPDQFQLNIQNISEKDIATIVYTSGTTGQPKGAVITHEALYQVLANVKKFTHNAIYEDDRLLTFLPLSHVLGRCESFFPLIFGCETVYAESINKLIGNIPIVKPTIMLAVPRIFEKIYEKVMLTLGENEIKSTMFNWASKAGNEYFDRIDNDKSPSTRVLLEYQLAKKLVFNKIYQRFGGRIRYFISGGAPLSPEIIKFLRNANLTILEGYGLTETIAPCCVNPMNKQIPGTVGQPIGDVEIKFAEDGEILIKSKALFSGYYKNEEATKEVMSEDGWFHSGDIGCFDRQGFLKITDRKKDIIITSGGKNVAPQKIEGMLKLSQYIAQSVIIGDKRKYLTALIGIEREAYEKHFSEFEISDECEVKDFANHPMIEQIVKAEIEKVNQDLASFESIKKFKILPLELTTDNYLTPSLKVKKKLILKEYDRLIDAMYN